MRDRLTLMAVLAVVAGIGRVPTDAAAQQPTLTFAPGSIVPGRLALPNPDSVLAIADRYLVDATKHADPADMRIFRQVQSTFRHLETHPDSVTVAISSLVTQLTLSLGDGQSPAGITMLSAFLMKLDPHNPRVTNLFGAVLHAGGRLRDASDVLALSVRQAAKQPGGGQLARLNLANVYIDRNLDATAKILLDSMLKKDPENRGAWRIMALYWFKQKNFNAQRDALLRGSTGGVGLIKRASAPVDAVVTKNEVKTVDEVRMMEQKLDALSKVQPLTSADIIEDIDPRLAQKIRKEALTALPDELWKLPLFPQVNTSDNKGYSEGMPIVEDWIKWFAMQYADHLKSTALGNTGMTIPSGSGSLSARDSARLVAQANAFAANETARALQQAQDAMKFLKGSNLPGVSKAQIDDALRQVGRAATAERVQLKDTKVDTSTPPGFDHGAPFARANYRNYLVATGSYERFFEKYFREFDGKEKEFLRLYLVKVQEESAVTSANMAAIPELEQQSPSCIPCKRESVRHLRVMNLLSAQYFKLWVNLYAPDYTQIMKPRLEAYWATAVVYLRNMVDPEVASREYFRVYGVYAQYAMQAGTFAGDGAAFAYIPGSEDEIAALEAAIADARVEVPQKHIQFMNDSVPRTKGQMPQFVEKADLKKDNPDWYDFLNGQGEVELNGQFLNLKMSRQKCEFRAWAFGPMAGVNFDFTKSQLQTYYGVSAEFRMGLKVGNVGVATKASADYIFQVNTIDMVAGTLSEAFPDDITVKVSAKGTLATSDAPVFEASADLKYNNTAGWNASFVGKAGTVAVSGKAATGGPAGNSASLTATDGFGPFTASGEISYSSKGGVTGKTGLSAGAFSANATANSQTGVQVVAQGGASAGGVSGSRTITYGQQGAAVETAVALALQARTKDEQPQIDSMLTSKFAQEFDVLAVGQRAIKDLSLPRP